ncbi:tetratricopeptide repeat protein, partial [bacterium]|nr:tetratricopeptide repeat protein [bacterium]
VLIGLAPAGETATSTANTLAGRPVAALSFLLNRCWTADAVWSYHLVNLLVHLAAGLLLWRTAVRTLGFPRVPAAIRADAEALGFAVALIWLVHPLATEAVTYLVQRTESLMAMFFLATLYLAIRAAGSPTPGRWHAAAVGTCALGMGCKEVMVVCPLVILAYDHVFLPGPWRERWRRRRGLYLGLAATWFWLGFLVATTPRPATGFGFGALTPWTYLKTEAGVVVHYLQLCFWPHPLVIDYADWPLAGPLVTVLPWAIPLALLALVAVVGSLARSPWGFLGLWFFLILAPTSTVLPSLEEVAAERRMYLPLAAVTTAVVVATRWLAQQAGQRLGVSARRLATCEAGLLVVVVTGLGGATWQRNQDYRSAIGIWQDAVAKRPQNHRAHDHLGAVLAAAGSGEQAADHFRMALRLRPRFTRSHLNLAALLSQQGRRAEAIDQLRTAARARPDQADVHHQLGFLLGVAGQQEDAIAEYRVALRLDPGAAGPNLDLGIAFGRQGDLAAAAEHFQAALARDPNLMEAHFNLAGVLPTLGNPDAALPHYAAAARLAPADPDVQRQWGRLLARLGRSAEARLRLALALELARAAGRDDLLGQIAAEQQALDTAPVAAP